MYQVLSGGSHFLGGKEMNDKILKDEKMVSVFHNIDRALKVYRHVSARIINASGMVADELSVPFGDFDRMIEKLDILSTFREDEGIQIVSRIRTLAKSRCLIGKINEALLRLKKELNGEIMYNVLCDTYINETIMTVAEIAEKYEISRTTYFRYKRKGMEHLAKYLWREDGETLDVVNEVVNEMHLNWVIE